MLSSFKILGFLALVALLFGQLEAGEVDAGHLIGKFKFNGDPNCPYLDAFLTAIGYTEDQKKELRAVMPTTVKEISMTGDEMTLTLDTGSRKTSHKFSSGNTFNETPVVGIQIQTVPFIEKDKLTLVRNVNGLTVKEVVACTTEECASTYNAKGITAEVKWKRM